MGKRSRDTSDVRFTIEGLEPRRLLANAYAFVSVGTALQSTEYDHTKDITALPGQPVAFDVRIQGTTNTVGQQAPVPTGTVKVYWQEGTVVGTGTYTLSLAGGSIDANGIATATATGTVTLDEALAPGQIGSYGDRQNFVWAEYQGDANYDDTASTGGLVGPDPNGNVVNVNFVPTHFAFTQQPSDAPANSAIAPPLAVALEDGGGAVDPYYVGGIALSVATGPAGGTFARPASTNSGEQYSGNDSGHYLSVTAVAGVGTFPDVELTAAGAYTLSGGAQTFFPSAVSNAFNVVAGNKLAFGQAPSDGTAKKPLRPPVTVKVEDASGNVKTDDNTTVVTLATVGFTGDAPITGNTATAVAGVATFPNLTLTTPGFYQLQATDAAADAAVTSAKFKVVGDHLKVVKQPPAANDGGAAVPITVELLDADDKLDTAATTYALLSLNVIAPGNNATLGGTVAAAFVGGIATFSAAAGPTVDAAGTYTFTATEANREQSTGAYLPTNTSTAIDTAQFKVAGAHLAIIGQPAKTNVGDAVTLTVAYENAQNKIVTTQNGAGVTLSLAPAATANAGGTAAVLGGAATVNFVRGVARFTVKAGPTVSLPGDYTLTATDPAAPAVAADVSKPFTVVGYHLAVRRQPTTADADAPIPLTFALLDGKNRVVTGENAATVTLTYKTLSDGVNAVQTGTLVKSLAGGVATFTAAAAPAFDRAGVFQFTATETGTAAVGTAASTQAVDTKPVRVLGDHLVFKPGPANASVDQPLKLAVELVDSHGDRVTGSDTVFKEYATLTLNTVTGGAGAALGTGGASGELVSGLAGYPKASVNRPGTFTVTATRTDGQGQSIESTAAVTSKPFKVTGLHIVTQVQPPADVLPDEPIPLKFALVDAKGKVDAAASGYSLAYTLTPTHGGAGAKLLNHLTAVPFTDGVADLTTDDTVGQDEDGNTLHVGRASVSDNPGTFVVDAQVAGTNPRAAAVESGRTRPFKVLPLHLAVQRAATTVAQYGSIPTRVALEDPTGRVDTFDSHTLLAVTLNGPGGAVVNGTGHAFAAGVVDLGVAGGVGVDTPGTYTLTLGTTLPDIDTTTPATAPITTAPLEVTALAVAITKQPPNTALHVLVPFAVALVDAAGKPVPALAVPLTAEETATLTTGLTPATVATGIADFRVDGSTYQQEGLPAIVEPGSYSVVVVLKGPDSKPIGSPVTSTPFVAG